MKKLAIILVLIAASPWAARRSFAGEAGGQTGMFIFDTRYIADTGSVLTNDTVYVSLVKTVSVIPDTTEVLVHARQVSSQNVADWFELTPRRTIADFPASYYLQSATNYNVLVTADYVPPTPVITNYTYTASAKIQMGITPVSSLPFVIPKSTLEEE